MSAPAPLTPKPRFSVVWCAALLLVVVGSGLLGGKALAVAFSHTKGSLLQTYNDKSFGISFQYPIYDEVRHNNYDKSFQSISAEPIAFNFTRNNYESDKSQTANVRLSIDIYKQYADQYYTAQMIIDEAKAACKLGSEVHNYGDGAADKGSYKETIVRADYVVSQQPQSRSAFCNQVVRSVDTFSTDSYGSVTYDYAGLIEVPGRGLFSVRMSIYGGQPSAQDEQTIQQIIRSFKPL